MPAPRPSWPELSLLAGAYKRDPDRPNDLLQNTHFKLSRPARRRRGLGRPDLCRRGSSRGPVGHVQNRTLLSASRLRRAGADNPNLAATVHQTRIRQARSLISLMPAHEPDLAKPNM